MGKFTWILLIFAFHLITISAQRSNCLNIFDYDSTQDEVTTSDNVNTLFGQLHLFKNATLHGIFIDIIFDRYVTAVGTHFYVATSPDNYEFHIEDENYKLRKGETLDMQFYVKYNRNYGIPGIQEIRLNGQIICSTRLQQTTSSSTTTTTRSPIINQSNVTRGKVENDRRTSSRPTVKIYNEDNTRYTSSITDFSMTTMRTTSRIPYFQGDLTYASSTIKSEIPKRSTTFQNNECGTVISKPNPLALGGEQTYRGQFPWHAALYVSNVGELKYICGGSLVSKTVVITAAHCVTYERSSRDVHIESLVLYLGKYNLRKWNGPEEDVKLSAVYIHPDFDAEKFYSDIAVIKLKLNVEFTDYIRPICLWTTDSDIRNVINTTGSVPGWGYDESGFVTEELAFVQMPIVSHETCIWSNRDLFSRITSDRAFCAGFRNGTSVCNGDSGGGLVLQQNQKWILRGLVSVSVALQNQFKCDPSHYVVFTDVAKFSTWIQGYL